MAHNLQHYYLVESTENLSRITQRCDYNKKIISFVEANIIIKAQLIIHQNNGIIPSKSHKVRSNFDDSMLK